ncbi:MAG: Ig-like domain-containing protein, partial [Armatimonadota bacterium]
MKHAGWRIAAAIAAAALAMLARGSAAAPEVSPSAARALQDYMRPWTAPTQADPAVLFGFTRYNHPGGVRWCQMLDGGNTSLKAFGSKDPVPATYHFWYRTEVRPVFAWERSFAGGREWLERQRTDAMKPVQAGEGALLDERTLKCLAYRGPLYLEVSLHLEWKLEAGPNVYEWSTALKQEWPAPYLGLASPDSITARKDACLKEAPDVLVGLVRDILAAAPVGGQKQAQVPAAKGPPVLKLTATPSALWADGTGKSTIRLEARDAQGGPLKGDFAVECSRGKLSHVKLITGASGVATAQYTAPAEGPGEDIIVVKAPDGTLAKVSIALGGIFLKPAGGEVGALFGDGKSAAELVVACVSPAGKPLPGTRVKLFADERELPARGRLSSDSVTAGTDGTARFAYTAPDVYSGNTGFKRGDAYITAVASVGNPPRAVRSVWRVPLYAGEVYLLEVSKPAFRRLEGFRVPAPARNGVLAGMVLARMPGGQNAPLRGALLRLSGPDGTVLGKGMSDYSGRFRFEFIGDRMSSAGREMELTEPVLLDLDE